MTTAVHLLAVIGLVFAINLMPAFGPPTWAVLVFAHFQWPDIPTAALIAAGALTATAGRLVLAVATRKLGRRVSPERRANLDALGQTLANSRTGVVASLGLFAVSPLPSAQMFMAAGLADLRLLPLAGAFLVGRSISHTGVLTAATVAQETVDRLLRQGFTSPSVIAIQLAALAAVVLMIKADWIKIIDRTRARVARMRGKPAPPSVRRPGVNPPEERQS